MLKVGNIVYLLDKKGHTIIPCMIVEQINSISLEGETTHHMMNTPTGKKIKLEGISAPWFKSLNEAREFLLETAKNLVDATIDKTKKITNEAFGPQKENDFTNEEFNPQKEMLHFKNTQSGDITDKTETVLIDLPDGQKARVTLPSET